MTDVNSVNNISIQDENSGTGIETSIKKINLDPNTNFFSHSMLQNVYINIKNGNVIEDGTLVESCDRLKIKLMTHQKRILYEMIEKENLKYRVSGGINAFILSDKVGSGKSIDILALICKYPLVNNIIPNKLIYKINNYINFKGFKIEATVNIKSNVIIVPHGIYNQWHEYIKNYTNLTVLLIKSKIDIDKLEITTFDKEYNIILIKSTKYKDFIQVVYNLYPYSTDTIPDNTDSLVLINRKLEKIKKLSYNSLFNIPNQDILSYIKSIKTLSDSINIAELENIIKNKGKYKLEEINVYKGPVFERVFIDEANSIRIPNMKIIVGKVNWFITSSLEDLFFPYGKKNVYNNKTLVNGIKGNGFIKDVFKNNSSKNSCNFIQDLFLKNNDKFIVNSFNLPDYIELKVHCYTPIEIKVLHGVAVPELMNALNAGDIESAIKHTGCESNTEDNIIDKVLFNFNNTLYKKQTILNEKISALQLYETYEDTEENKLKKKNLSKSIKLYTDTVSDLVYKISCIKTRLSDVCDKDCPICSTKVTNPSVTPCCKNIFCFECIVMSLNYSKNNQCPLCRTMINYNQLLTIKDKADIPLQLDKLPTKLESLIKIIKNKPNGKFLIFSEYDKSINNILTELTSNTIVYSKLLGSSGHITNIIDKYKKGDINVLLLNAKHFGSIFIKFPTV